MKVLFVGLGGIGQRHLRNLLAVAGEPVEVMAFRVRRSPVALTETLQVRPGSDLEAEYGIEVFDDLDAALGRSPDTTFVCNPTSSHLDVALRAVEAGCHVFLEKPLAHRAERVRELVEALERSGRVGMVGFQLRFHPSLLHLREVLRTGTLGRILAVRAQIGEYLPDWHKYEDYRRMYAAREELGGGVVLSQIHELDYLYWLFGLPRRIFAIGGRLSSLEVDVEDVASLLMEVEVDGVGIPMHVHEDFIQRPPTRNCEIIGDRGRAKLDLTVPSLEICAGEGAQSGPFVVQGFQRNQLFLDEMTHFLRCIRGQETPIVTMRDGAQSLLMALAAKRSLASGLPVDIAAVAREWDFPSP